MGLTFHELILDESYGLTPQGGPEFSHSVFAVPTSGVEDVARNYPTALHRYVIPYELLRSERRSLLYSFFLAVGGVGGAFRMVAPEAHNQAFEDEPMAGSASVYRLVKTHSFTAEVAYGGNTSSYVQRIIKPVYGELEIYVAGVPVDLTADGTMDWTTGTFTFDAPPASTPRATGRYHLPVRFTQDWLSMRHDVSSDWDGVELKEVLPKTIGINA